MHNLFAGYNVEEAKIDYTFGVLSRRIYGIDWPIKRSRDDMIRNDLASYIDEDKRALQFDVLRKWMRCFHRKTNRESICKILGFHKCKRGICFIKSYGPCDHMLIEIVSMFQYR